MLSINKREGAEEIEPKQQSGKRSLQFTEPRGTMKKKKKKKINKKTIRSVECVKKKKKKNRVRVFVCTFLPVDRLLSLCAPSRHTCASTPASIASGIPPDSLPCLRQVGVRTDPPALEG